MKKDKEKIPEVEVEFIQHMKPGKFTSVISCHPKLPQYQKDCEYCTPPSPTVGWEEMWKDRLNRRFEIKQSISGRWIYCLNDDDLEEENEYSFLDDFIERLLSSQRAETIQRVEEIVPEWIDNPYGEVNDYTIGRRDERKEIRQALSDVVSKLKGEE